MFLPDLAEQRQVNRGLPRIKQFERRLVLARRSRARQGTAFAPDLAAEQIVRADPFLCRKQQHAQVGALFGEPFRRVGGGERRGVLRRQIKDLVAKALAHRPHRGKQGGDGLADPGRGAGVEPVSPADRFVRRGDQVALTVPDVRVGENHLRHRRQPLFDPRDLEGGVASDRLKQPVVEAGKVLLFRLLAYLAHLARRRTVDHLERAAPGFPRPRQHREQTEPLAARLSDEIGVGRGRIARNRREQNEVFPVEDGVARDAVPPPVPFVQIGDRLALASGGAALGFLVGQGTRPPPSARQAHQLGYRQNDRVSFAVVSHRVSPLSSRIYRAYETFFRKIKKRLAFLIRVC